MSDQRLTFDVWQITAYVDGQRAEDEADRIHREVNEALTAWLNGMKTLGYTLELGQ